MNLKELLETHKECKQFKQIINRLYKGLRNYDYATKKMSEAYDLLNNIRGRIPEKKIQRMEKKMFVIETEFEEAYWTGAFG
jgi:hypothetical protein